MKSTVTVSIRSLAVVAIALLAVVAAYLAGDRQPGVVAAAAPEPAAAEVAPADPPKIVMTGTGEAVGVPDQLTFSFAVNEQAADVSTALESANDTTRRVLRALTENGVERRDVKTTALSVRPVYDYSDDGPPVLTGYAATQRHSVVVRALKDAGEAISAAVEAGGNTVRVSGIKLSIGDVDALMQRARQAAVQEATTKAEQYAAATGIDLGQVISVREVTATPAPAPYAGDLQYATRDALSQVPIRAGSAELKVTVSVEWSLGTA